MTRNFRESRDQFPLKRICQVFLTLVSLTTVSRPVRAAVIEVTGVDGETIAQADAHTLVPFGGDEFDSDNDAEMADSFADFPLSVEANANTSQASAHADAQLDASISGNQISAEGGASALALAGEPNSARATAAANFSATFSLARSLAYRLSWGYTVEVGSGGSITLRSPDEVIFSGDALDGFGGRLEMGVLDAGEYTLSASAVAFADSPGSGSPGPATTTFAFDFMVVPEPESAVLIAMVAMTLSASLRRSRAPRTRIAFGPGNQS